MGYNVMRFVCPRSGSSVQVCKSLKTSTVAVKRLPSHKGQLSERRGKDLRWLVVVLGEQTRALDGSVHVHTVGVYSVHTLTDIERGAGAQGRLPCLFFRLYFLGRFHAPGRASLVQVLSEQAFTVSSVSVVSQSQS